MSNEQLVSSPMGGVPEEEVDLSANEPEVEIDILDDTPEEDREEDNPNYYVGNPNCHQGARYYKLAFIMRKN